jgi:hypothetical protein
MAKNGGAAREDNQQTQARLLVIERGEQELREMVRDLTRTIAKLDESNQLKTDQLASEFRAGMASLQQAMVSAREADLTRADDHGFRLWGPALTVAGMLLTGITLVIGGSAFYLNQRFDFVESDVAEVDAMSQANMLATAETAQLRDNLQNMQTQVNLYRDYEHRIQAMNRDQPDPGPRYFPGTHTAIGTASPKHETTLSSP